MNLTVSLAHSDFCLIGRTKRDLVHLAGVQSITRGRAVVCAASAAAASAAFAVVAVAAVILPRTPATLALEQIIYELNESGLSKSGGLCFR